MRRSRPADVSLLGPPRRRCSTADHLRRIEESTKKVAHRVDRFVLVSIAAGLPVVLLYVVGTYMRATFRALATALGGAA